MHQYFSFSPKILILMFVALHFSVGCSSSRPSQEKAFDLASFQQFAREKLGKSAVVLPNNSQSYLLCISNSPKQLYPAFPQRAFRFFVYDIDKDSIVYEASLENGSVAWFSNSELIIKTIPGIIEEDGITIMTHTYNLLTRQKNALTED